MVRRFLLLPLLTVALAGFVKGQGATHTKVYPIPTEADGAVAEYEIPEQLKVLDDFISSGFLVKYDKALKENDREAFDRMIADQALYVDERFGKGEYLTKAGFMNTFGEKKVIHVFVHRTDHARLRAFGDNAVLFSGQSTSVLTYHGKMSNSSRLFANVYMKLDGRWQLVSHCIMDYNGLLKGSTLTR